jgi:hypothetical protein
VSTELSPVKRFDEGDAALLRSSALFTIGRNTLCASATRVALIAGSKRLTASSGLFSRAMRTASSRESRTVSAADAVCAV